MKKSTLSALVSYLNGETLTNLDEIKAELEKELTKGAEKAAANRALYEDAHDVVINGLISAGEPVTVAELYDLIKEDLPNGFSRSKVQYGMLNYWVDELVVVDGNPKTYTVKA